MSPIHETFRFLYLSRHKRGDLNPAFGALIGTSVLAYLNLLVVVMITDPFTGYFSWLGRHGVLTLIVIALSVVTVAGVLYFCWIYGDKLKRVRVPVENAPRPRSIVVYIYIVVSFLAVPIAGILMHSVKT
jgi:hypothetical protein